MALLNNRITAGEKAAIFYGIFMDIQDWRLLYAIADGIKDLDNVDRSTVSRWKNTLKVKELIKQANTAKYELIEAAKKQGFQDGKNAVLDNVRSETENDGKRAKIVDYSDPVNQKRKLNELINTATDSGEALDALKVIIQGQKADRDAAKEGKTVRAYLPLCCNDCPLYEKARKKPRKT